MIHDQNAQTSRRIIETGITFCQHGLAFAFSVHLSMRLSGDAIQNITQCDFLSSSIILIQFPRTSSFIK